MDTAQLREKNAEELRELLRQELQAQFNLRMQKGTGQLSAPSEIKKTRRNIARVKTILNEKSGQTA